MPIICNLQIAIHRCIRLFGNNQIRIAWIKSLHQAGIPLLTLVHDTACVSPTVQIEPGSIILSKVVVNIGCQVKCGCIINCGAVIDRGSVL